MQVLIADLSGYDIYWLHASRNYRDRVMLIDYYVSLMPHTILIPTE